MSLRNEAGHQQLAAGVVMWTCVIQWMHTINLPMLFAVMFVVFLEV